jgi:hypothetical protein
MARPNAVVLLLVAGGCVPRPPAAAPTSAIARVWPGLVDGNLAERITDPMVSIRHEQANDDRYRVAALAVSLDGKLLQARRLDRLRPPERTLSIYDGRVRPGRHELGVQLLLEDTAGGLANESPHRIAVEAHHIFVIAEGQFASVGTRTRDLDPGPGPAPGRVPSVDFEVQFRPIRSD